MMIKLAVFDIDGTLFDEKNKRIPFSAVQSLEQLKRRGVLVAIATGRPPMTASSLNGEGIFPDYFICSNGHVLADCAGAVIAERTFPSELAEQVWEYCAQEQIGLLWKYPDATYVYRGSEQFDLIFAKNKGGASVHEDDHEVHRRRGPNGGCLSCSTEQLAQFNRKFQGKCHGVDINGLSSDLLLWGVTKQTGLETLLKLISVAPEECIAFGDNRNDLELIQYAGIGVAMGNGEDELKEQSDYVTLAVEDDGVEAALRHFNLI